MNVPRNRPATSAPAPTAGARQQNSTCAAPNAAVQGGRWRMVWAIAAIGAALVGGCASTSLEAPPGVVRANYRKTANSEIGRRCPNSAELLAQLKYPRALASQGIFSGEVNVAFTIQESGRVADIRIETSTHSLLTEPVVAAVERFTCASGTAPVRVLLPVSYRVAGVAGVQPSAMDDFGVPAGFGFTRMIWISNIQQKVGRGIVVPEGTPPDAYVRYSVSLRPDGNVASVRMVGSSGHAGFERTVAQAIKASSPLPKPDMHIPFPWDLELHFSAGSPNPAAVSDRRQ